MGLSCTLTVREGVVLFTLTVYQRRDLQVDSQHYRSVKPCRGQFEVHRLSYVCSQQYLGNLFSNENSRPLEQRNAVSAGTPILLRHHTTLLCLLSRLCEHQYSSIVERIHKSSFLMLMKSCLNFIKLFESNFQITGFTNLDNIPWLVSASVPHPATGDITSLPQIPILRCFQPSPKSQSSTTHIAQTLIMLYLALIQPNT